MKKLLSIIGVIFGIIIVGLIILSFSIDGMVKSGIQDSGSAMLKTQVNVDDVGISIFGGTGTIDGISIHNPKGFSDNDAVKLKEISMKIDLSSLLSDTVIVENLTIKKPELYFEQKNTSNNLNTLKKNMGSGSSTDTRVVIDRLFVEDGLVRLSAKLANEEESAQAKFDHFELTGIGRKGNNTMDQTLRQVMEPILQRAIQQALKEGLLDKAKEKVKDLLGG